jgi:hypothetical protein
VHNISYVRQIEIHIAESLVCDSVSLEVKIDNAELEKYKLPGNDHISVELIQAGVEILWSISVNSIIL